MAPAGPRRWMVPLATVVFCIGAHAAPAYAEGDNRAARRWSLAELTDYALSHQPSTRVAWATARIDQAAIGIARAELLPSLDADVSITWARNSAAPADNSTTAGHTTRTISPSLTLGWVLWDFGARADAVDAARYQAAASALSANRALQTVASDVEQAYYTLLGAREARVALAATLDSAQLSYDSTNARLRQGVGTRAEVAESGAALAAARLALIKARSTEASATGALKFATGMALGDALEIAADEPAERLLAGSEGDARADTPALSPRLGVDDWLALARRQRPELAGADAGLRQAQAELSSARAARWPVLSLAAGAARSYPDPGADSHSEALTLNLSLPLFDGGLRRAQVRQAQARVDAAEAGRTLQGASIDLDVWQSYQAAAISDEALDAARIGLDSALIAERAARQRYSAGVATLLEVLSAQAAAAQARLSLVQARYDGLLALSQLAYAVGANPLDPAPQASSATPSTSTPLPPP